MGATWMTVLSAGLLGLAAGCSAAVDGEGDGVATTPSATVKATEPSGAASTGVSTSPVKPSTGSSEQPTGSSRTTAVLQRISDPQVVADRLVRAWMRHDTSAANKLTRDGAPIEVLFSEQAPSIAPSAIPCRLVSLGEFACSYTLAPRAELTIIVAGGASAGYEVTGVEFGD